MMSMRLPCRNMRPVRKVSVRDGQMTDIPSDFSLETTASRISLMRSERGKNGMIYTELGGNLWHRRATEA